MKLFSLARFWMSLALIIIILIICYFIIAGHITPMTNDAFIQSYAVKVSPQVPGRITKIYVKNNQLVNKGDLLFKIYQPPYRYAALHAEANLVATENKVAELKASISQTEALIAERKSNLETAKQHYQELSTLAKAGYVSASQMLDVNQRVADTQAQLAQAIQSLNAAKQNLGSEINGVNVHIKQAQTALATAQLNLKETKVYAPAPGTIVNLHTYVGNYANQGEIQMSIVSQKGWWIQANYEENNLSNIKIGQSALISINMYPG